MIPKYALPNIDRMILNHCVERTLEWGELAVLDWKGIKSEHKPKLVEMLKKIDMPFKKVKHYK